MEIITICDNCNFKTNDGCGPGTVMLCGHPSFKDAHNYENAIIQWIFVTSDRRACSDKCPIIISHKQELEKILTE